MVWMRRDFLYQLIEKYFEQLIDSLPNFKANGLRHFCAAACPGTCQAHMQCTAAIDESVHLNQMLEFSLNRPITSGDTLQFNLFNVLSMKNRHVFSKVLTFPLELITGL